MLHLKAPNQVVELEPLASWGAFTRNVEIGDDRFAVRHVDVFTNGYSLKYDRSHWVDALGMLAGMRYDRKRWSKWWGPPLEISPEEFETIWLEAVKSPVRAIQLREEKMSTMGAIPIWLVKLQRGG